MVWMKKNGVVEANLIKTIVDLHNCLKLPGVLKFGNWNGSWKYGSEGRFAHTVFKKKFINKLQLSQKPTSP